MYNDKYITKIFPAYVTHQQYDVWVMSGWTWEGLQDKLLLLLDKLLLLSQWVGKGFRLWGGVVSPLLEQLVGVGPGLGWLCTRWAQSNRANLHLSLNVSFVIRSCVISIN